MPSKIVPLRLRCGFFLALLLILSQHCVLANQGRPNVLFIAIDDLNDWIGCLKGHPQALTPNIDRLASRGVLFANAHCASPACNPSRAAVFSGQMPSKTNVWSNETKRLMQLHPDMMVLPRAMKRAGYVTLGTGKLLHSSGLADTIFDRYHNVAQRWSPLTKKSVEYTKDELPTKKTNHPKHTVNAHGKTFHLPLNQMPSDRRPERVDGESFDWGPMDVPNHTMGDMQIVDWSIEQLNAGFSNKSFFMGVGFYRPHIPLWAPKKYFDRFENETIHLPDDGKETFDALSKIAQKWAVEPVTAGSHATVVQYDQWSEAVKAYLACTTFVDDQVGRLLDCVDSGPHADNTMIVLWTDHGWHLGEKQHWGKWTGWERSTRVPLIIAPPQTQADLFRCAGKVCNAPVSLLDLYPTITDMCDVAAPSGLDGRSLAPQMFNPGKASDRIVATQFDRGNLSLRNNRYRYIVYREGDEELYDLKTDPAEDHNLIDSNEHQTLATKMRQRAKAISMSAGS